MAGLSRADMQKYGRSSCWFSAVFLMLAAHVIAQTDDNNVLTVADANWTLILQGEWMIKLSEWEVSGYNTADYISVSPQMAEFIFPQQIHTYLTNTLGIPSWGSYVIFAIITLFMGLMLGLMLVLIADCIWPSRPKHREDKSVVIVKEEVSEEEVEDIMMEEKRTSDLDNESERVSGDESTEEEGQTSDGAAGGSDQPPSEEAAESSVRKRKPQGSNTTEGT
ncbi:thioredoxin-related transmembrane 4 [Labeo rohita]|uniref:Thioredoxin-related transmembrane 4 n=1 Tax=Labeo rohita TaxID=84645 RepID=A0A498MC42_LABRO|nr:thioredoxin-related transmembrane 4 [Labeo rohita]